MLRNAVFLALLVSASAFSADVVLRNDIDTSITVTVVRSRSDSAAVELVEELRGLSSLVDCPDCTDIEFYVRIEDKATHTVLQLPYPFEAWQQMVLTLADTPALSPRDLDLLVIRKMLSETTINTGAIGPAQLPTKDNE